MLISICFYMKIKYIVVYTGDYDQGEAALVGHQRHSSCLECPQMMLSTWAACLECSGMINETQPLVSPAVLVC